MKRVSITILTMIIIGGIVFSGYKLYEYKDKAISEVEVMLFTPSVVESEINTKRIVNEEILANENTLKDALQEALSRIDELNDHIQKKEFEYDKILNITSSQDTSFTDVLDTDNNIEELEDCTYNSENKEIE